VSRDDPQLRGEDCEPHRASINFGGPCRIDGAEKVDVGLLIQMAALANDIPAVPVARASLDIARFLAANANSLSEGQAFTLLVLGASLWQRSIILGDTVDEIDAMMETTQCAAAAGPAAAE
jgi:hypothetical protein